MFDKTSEITSNNILLLFSKIKSSILIFFSLISSKILVILSKVFSDKYNSCK